MNEVIQAVRDKYPEYAGVPDDQLTAALANKYPEYLSNASFKADVDRPASGGMRAATWRDRIIAGVSDWKMPNVMVNNLPDAETEDATSKPLIKEIPRAEYNPNESGIVSAGKGIYNVGAGIGNFLQSGTGMLTTIPVTRPVGEAQASLQMLRQYPQTLAGAITAAVSPSMPLGQRIENIVAPIAMPLMGTALGRRVSKSIASETAIARQEHVPMPTQEVNEAISDEQPQPSNEPQPAPIATVPIPADEMRQAMPPEQQAVHAALDEHPDLAPSVQSIIQEETANEANTPARNGNEPTAAPRPSENQPASDPVASVGEAVVNEAKPDVVQPNAGTGGQGEAGATQTASISPEAAANTEGGNFRDVTGKHPEAIPLPPDEIKSVIGEQKASAGRQSVMELGKSEPSETAPAIEVPQGATAIRIGDMVQKQIGGEKLPAMVLRLQKEAGVKPEDVEFGTIGQGGKFLKLKQNTESGSINLPSEREVRAAPFGIGTALLRAANQIAIHADNVKNAFKTRDLKGDIASLYDGAQGMAAKMGQEVGSRYNLMLGEGLRDAAGKVPESQIDLRARALTLAASGDLTKGQFARALVANWDKPGTDRAAYNYAIKNWGDMAKMRAEHQQLTAWLLQTAADHGINLEEKTGYVPQRWEQKPGRTDKINFRRESVYANVHEGINAGDVPQSLDIRNLMQQRTMEQMRRVNKVVWVDQLRNIESPVTGKGVVQDMVDRIGPDGKKNGMEPPKGYVQREIIPGHMLAVEKNFAKTVDAMTDMSHIPRTVMNAFGLVKHGMVGFDSYHLGRLIAIEAAYGHTIGYKNGLTALNYADVDLPSAVRQGLIKPEQAAFAMKVKGDVGEGLKRGLQASRVSDALYRDFINSTPVLRQTAGAFTHFLFEKFQRGATVQTYMKNLERLRDLHGDWKQEQIYQKAVDDTNLQFRNFGKQGVFRNATMQDFSRLAFFAPQWFEGLVKGTAVGYGEMAGFAKNALMGKPLVRGAVSGKLRVNIGNNAAGAIGGTLALVAANQLLNYATTGHSTFENPEGHKLDAWIPSWSEDGEGYWFNPMSYFQELTGDMMKYSDYPKSDWQKVTGRIFYNKLHPVPRATYNYWKNEDFYGHKAADQVERLKMFGKAVAPIPLAFQATYAALNPDEGPDNQRAGQQQLFQSLGMKLNRDYSGGPNPAPATGLMRLPIAPMSSHTMQLMKMPLQRR